MFDLELEDLEYELRELDHVSEASEGPSPLTKEDREAAIKIFATYYIGKYPIEYFHDNEDGKHDRIIARVDIPDGEHKATFEFMKTLLAGLNRSGTNGKFTFFYMKPQGFIIANFDDKKSKSKDSNDDDKEDSHKVEETGLEFIGVKDLFGAYEVSDLQYIPLVQEYKHQGLNTKQAVDLMEMYVIAHPLALLDLVPESYFKTSDDYDMYLIGAFAAANEMCNNNLDLLEKSMKNYSVEEMYSATTENINMVKMHAQRQMRFVSEADSKPISHIARDKINEAKKKLTPAARALEPVITKMKETVDELVGDKAVKEEVIQGSGLLRFRRIFMKLIVVWKSKALMSAGLALFGIGFPWSWIIIIIHWLARMKFYAGTASAVLNNGEDHDNEVGRKRVLQELELELKITREKIEDARSAGDQKAKYQLIRIENTLEKEIYRIRYNKAPEDYIEGKLSK